MQNRRQRALKGFGCVDDGNAVEVAQHQQIVIVRDDHSDLSRESKHVVVIGIAAHQVCQWYAAPNSFTKRHFRAETNGFSTFTPNRLKSFTLRVTTVSLCTFAAAAIIASS